MQIFVDTANIEQIRQAAKPGIVRGVTTNPSLLSKEATADYETVTKKICAIISGPVSVEVLAEDAEGMMAEAHVATVPYNVLMQMIQHPLTDIGIKRFLEDWQKVSK